MSWSIPIEKLAAQAQAKVEDVVRKVTFDLFRAVVLRSPVDTGRFRANWNVSFNAPNYTVQDTTAKQRGLGQANKALTLPIGGITYMTNGLPYARRLEHGWSGQAPQGMVRLSVIEMRLFVRKALAS